MAIKLENKTRVAPVSGSYPFGNIKDSTPTVKGTPVNVETYADFHQFFAKILDQSGIIANGLADNFTNGFQYFQALINVINSEAAKAIILSIIGPYTADDVIILYGCKVSDVIPGISDITEGAIYYNGRIYYVPENLAIPSPADTLVYKIDATVQPEFIYLDNDVTGSGIADFDGATVKEVNRPVEFIGQYITGGVTISKPGSITNGSFQAIKRGGIVFVSGFLNYDPGGYVSPVNDTTFTINLLPKYYIDGQAYAPTVEAFIGFFNVAQDPTKIITGAVGRIKCSIGTDDQLDLIVHNSPEGAYNLYFAYSYLAKEVL